MSLDPNRCAHVTWAFDEAGNRVSPELQSIGPLPAVWLPFWRGNPVDVVDLGPRGQPGEGYWSFIEVYPEGYDAATWSLTDFADEFDVLALTVTRAWSAEADEAPAPSNPVLTRLEFRRLFTFEERNAFDNYPSNPELTDDQKGVLRTFEVDFNAAQDVSLIDPDTEGAISFFVFVGLLTPERAAEILAYRK